MKLTVAQIAEIKTFISKRGIEYLDVQMEVLDHVASQVEEQLTNNPNLSFDAALKQTHASFGVFGFSVIEDSIADALSKKYNKFFWSNFLLCFNLKHIILVLFGGFLLYQTQVIIDDNDNFIMLCLLAIVIIFGILLAIIINSKIYKRLLVYRTSFLYFVFFGLIFQISSFVIQKTSHTLILGVYSDFLISSILFLFFIIYIFSAIKTAMVGIKESKKLMDKFAECNEN